MMHSFGRRQARAPLGAIATALALDQLDLGFQLGVFGGQLGQGLYMGLLARLFQFAA